MHLRSIKARAITDSRNDTTIEVIVKCDNFVVSASVPKGKSKSAYEVCDIAVGGIKQSINFVNEIGKKLIASNFKIEQFDDLAKLEQLAKQYDATQQLKHIGGNALLALELALLRAFAKLQQVELWQFLAEKKPKRMPLPLGNAIGGGKHSIQHIKPDFQEFLLLPKAKSFAEAQFINMQAYKQIGVMLKKSKVKFTYTDENAYCPQLDNVAVLRLLDSVKEFINKNYSIELSLGLDIAASSLWNGYYYCYDNFPGKAKLNEKQQLSFVNTITKQFNLFYIEDAFAEDSFDYFALLLQQTKNKAVVCGDDLIATNIDRLKKAIKMKAVNAIIIKPNQVGSLIKTKQIVDLAIKHKIKLVFSHRSGETLDDWLADLAVAWHADYVKVGITGRERMAKILRLMKIEHQLR